MIVSPIASHHDWSKLAAAACAYGAAGWKVLPLNGKRPVMSMGKNFAKASSDPETVRQWWEAYPGSNIGLLADPGTVIIDLDPRHGGTPAVLAELNSGPLPATATVRTGSGGWHYYYTTRNTQIGNSAGKLAPGIDTRAGGHGYVVAPPSLHPDTGRPYTWENTGPLVALPRALERLLAPRPRERLRPLRRGETDGLTGLIAFVESGREGERNARLFWAACRMGERVLEGKAADLKGLETAGLTAGLPPAEVVSTISSGLKASGVRNER